MRALLSSSPRRRKVLYILMVSLLAFGVFWKLGVTLPRVHKQIDFGPYYAAGIQARSSQPFERIYETGAVKHTFQVFWNTRWPGTPLPKITSRYFYPPFFGYLIAPLTLFPSYTSARMAWVFLLVGAFLSTALCLAFSVPKPFRLFMGCAFLVMLLLSWPVERNLVLGQANPLVLLSLAVSYLLLTRGRGWASGAAAAFGSFLKFFSIFAAPAFLICRHWKAFVGLLIGGLLFLGLSIGMAGWNAHLAFLSKTIELVTSPRKFTDASSRENPTLDGFLARAFSKNAHTTPWFVLSRSTTSHASLTLLILCMLSLFLVVRFRFPSGQLPVFSDAIVFGLFVMLPTLFSGIGQVHYLIFAIPLQLFLLTAVVARMQHDRSRFCFGLLLAVSLSLFLIHFPFPDATWTHRGMGVLFYQPAFLGLLLSLGTGILYLLSFTENASTNRKKALHLTHMRNSAKHVM